VLLIISIPAAASLRGFYLGRRAAWEWAAGRSPIEFVQSDWLLGPVSRRFYPRRAATLLDGDRTNLKS
jgi:hypothetical protein